VEINDPPLWQRALFIYAMFFLLLSGFISSINFVWNCLNPQIEINHNHGDGKEMYRNKINRNTNSDTRSNKSQRISGYGVYDNISNNYTHEGENAYASLP
jgi:hypothetical protein